MEEKVSKFDAETDPLSVLSANCESLECASTMIIGVHNKCTFQVTLKVNKKRRYIASASSALLAKKKAAKVALEDIRKKPTIQQLGETRENLRISVKNIEELLKKTAEGETSNDVAEYIEAENNFNLAISPIKDVPTNEGVSNSTDFQYPGNVENMNRIIDDELPTTSKNAAKYISAQKKQDAVNILSPPMKKTNIHKFQRSSKEKLEMHKEKESGSAVNRNQLKAMELKKTSSPDVREIMKEAGVDTELLDETPSSIMEKINLVEDSVVDIGDKTVSKKSITPITAIDLETINEDNKSVGEIINECLSQILHNAKSSDDTGSDKDVVIPIVESTNSDDDSVVIEIDEESAEHYNGDLREYTKDNPSNPLEIIEINEDAGEPPNSTETVDVNAIEIDHSDCTTKHGKKTIGFGDNAISPDVVDINKSVDAGKRRVTMPMRGVIKNKYTNRKQRPAVKRFIKNPINFSEGTQQVCMPPTKQRAAFRKPILKPTRTCNSLNASHHQKKNSPPSSNINNNNEIADMNEENIVHRLNQIFPGIRYNLEAETISSDNSFFLMSATLNDRKYFGDGQTRSEAIINIAKQILKVLNDILIPQIQSDNPKQGHVRGSIRPHVQFKNQEQESQCQNRRNVIPQVQFVQPSQVRSCARRNIIPQVQFVKPSHGNCSIRTQVQFANQEEATESHVRFSEIPQNPPTQSHAQHNGKPQRNVRRNDIPQMSSTKRRQTVHKQVRFDVTPQVRFFTVQQKTEAYGSPNIGCDTGFNMSTLSLPQHKADVVEKLILNHFRLVNGGNTKLHNFKVLAGIVMTHSLNFENAQVVALATGAKCVNNTANINYNGCVLNDCHAVVIARRCLMKYLYTQLRWHCYPEWAEKSIFVRNPSGLQYAFALKQDVQFHLYINTAPCGDARVFGDRNNYEQYGQLRTKDDGGMCTTTIGNRFLSQTLDGINHGDPLLTMSCSDKIVRWNVLGLQGSLLSTLIEPIYLYSIVLGNKFHTQHLYRAVCGRLEQNLNFLPKPYHLNRPLLGQTSAATQFPNDNNRGYGLGMNWTFGDDQIELVSLARGVLQNNVVSYLSKQVLFSKYIYLLQHLSKLGIFPYPNNYAKAKEQARDYQTAKQEMFDAFQHAGLGCWVKRPFEQNCFALDR